jgi:hypothetical protein
LSFKLKEIAILISVNKWHKPCRNYVHNGMNLPEKIIHNFNRIRYLGCTYLHLFALKKQEREREREREGKGKLPCLVYERNTGKREIAPQRD